MIAVPAQLREQIWLTPQRRLAILIGLSSAQALSGPVVVAIRDHGLSGAMSSLFGVSLAVWLALVVAVQTLWNADGLDHQENVGTAEILLALSWLLPSATVSWLALALYASWKLPGSKGDIRTGLLIGIALAVREPAAAVALGLLAAPTLTGDAVLVAALLNLFGQDVTRAGNIVVNAQGMELLVLTGCASFSNLSLALLAWFAFVRSRVGRLTGRHAVNAACLGCAIVAANVVRLALMSTSPAAYTWLHDGPGVHVFQAALLALIAASAWMAVRHER